MTQSFYLGCNSANGFYSLFNQLYNPLDNWKLYIIKGGPGTGKSRLIKSIAEISDSKSYYTEKIYCSSDPDSLDGLILHNLKIAITDGTPPHIMDPKFPGVSEEIIYLGEYWDRNKLLLNKSEIQNLTIRNSNTHNNCKKFIELISNIINENDKLIYKYINKAELQLFLDKYYTERENKNIQYRISKAITPKGYYYLKNDYSKYNITYLKDDYNIISDIVLNIIHKNSSEIKVIKNCFKTDRIDYIIFKDIIISKIKDVGDENEIIDLNLFYNKIPESVVIKYNENKRKMTYYINKAVLLSKKAKEIHDKIEKYYIEAMNFDKVNNITECLINEIFNET